MSMDPKQPIASHDLGQILGEERLQWLMAQTGMSKDELLRGLSAVVPGAIQNPTPTSPHPER